MGQKINPQILRLGHLYQWQSRWFADKKYKETLLEDYKIRKTLFEKLKIAGIGKVEIERSINSLKITIYVSRPGIVIGRAGTGLEELKKFLTSLLSTMHTKKDMPKLDIRIEAIKEPSVNAYLIAKNISEQLIKRLPYKRLLAQAAARAMEGGAKGIRIVLSGRVAGAEISRREKIQIGKVPLSTIREQITFASVPSLTKKGYIGVKVWVNRGEK